MTHTLAPWWQLAYEQVYMIMLHATTPSWRPTSMQQIQQRINLYKWALEVATLSRYLCTAVQELTQNVLPPALTRWESELADRHVVHQRYRIANFSSTPDTYVVDLHQLRTRGLSKAYIYVTGPDGVTEPPNHPHYYSMDPQEPLGILFEKYAREVGVTLDIDERRTAHMRIFQRDSDGYPCGRRLDRMLSLVEQQVGDGETVEVDCDAEWCPDGWCEHALGINPRQWEWGQDVWHEYAFGRTPPHQWAPAPVYEP